MSLNNYVLNGPSVVIADDQRDPHVSWQHHLERAGRGGVDLVAVVGTPVLAPTSGFMRHFPNDGSAGNSCRFVHDQNVGWSDVFSHLSRYVGGNNQHFNQGDVIAYTGNTGGVVQHLHRHLLDPSGTRRNPWDYFSSSTAGGGSTPIINLEDTTMYPIILNGDHYFLIGPCQIKHETTISAATFIRNVTTNNDAFIRVGDAEMTALCESFGVPWYAVQATLNGNAYQIDGQPNGHFWSKEFENAAKLDQLLARK